jgi:isochorismate hydrolase
MAVKRFTFNPKKAALLVIDMQDYFTKPGGHAFIPSSRRIIPRIVGLVKAFNKVGRPVIFTRHIDVNKGNVMNRWWHDSISRGNPLSRLNKAMPSGLGRVIVKHEYDAFYKTPLLRLLKKTGTRQVVITGVVAHLCCETTARSAFCRDLEVFFAMDGTASYDKRHHKAAMYNLSHGFAVMVKCGEMVKKLSA